ncbi:ABC transporter substrate-binding protein [Streptomyces sp. bgisy091]|uniref:ABC transporter substrate-binding protein n=1 Tax=Streptomyces sp. bgisy091 TaxID=3413778 RepID=UPI003D733F31
MAVATVLVSAGCGSGVPPQADVSAPGFGSGAHGTVQVWARSNTQAAVQGIADAFNRSHRGLRVQVTPIPDGQYVTKLATALRSGNVPDAVDLDDVNTTVLAYREALTDLTPLVDALPFEDRLSPGHLDLATVGGRQYAVPLAGDVSVLFYNKELFRKAGLDPDDPPRTYADVLAAGRAVKRLEGVTAMTIGGNSPGIMGFTALPSMWNDGGRLIEGPLGGQRARITGNTPLRDMLSFYRTAWRGGLITPASRNEAGATWSGDFLAGRAAMWPGSYGAIMRTAPKDLKDRLGVASLPSTSGRPGGFAGGDSIAIPRGADNPSGAWEFMRYALSAAQQEAMAEQGYTPVRTDAGSDRWRRANPVVAASQEILRTSTVERTLGYNVLINQVSGPWLSMFTDATFGPSGVDAAMRDAQPGFDRVLEASQS